MTNPSVPLSFCRRTCDGIAIENHNSGGSLGEELHGSGDHAIALGTLRLSARHGHRAHQRQDDEPEGSGTQCWTKLAWRLLNAVQAFRRRAERQGCPAEKLGKALGNQIIRAPVLTSSARPPMAVSSSFRLGDWRVDPSLRTVTGASGEVRLEPKLMQVLVLLAERPGQVVGKDQLLQTVWADTFVGDEVLSRTISELRRVFGDDPKSPR